MAKYTFIKDYDYTVYGIGAIHNTIKKGQSFDGIETKDGIVISTNGSDLSNYKKEVLSPDQISSYLTVPKEYLRQSFLQKHKNHLLLASVLILGVLAFKKFKK